MKKYLFLVCLMIFGSVVEAKTIKKAIFAGGCFWCMEPPYDQYLKKGILNVLSGYSGGTKELATYSAVSDGGSKHKEVIEVEYDSSLISYEKLVDIFWSNVDPLDSKGQFCDKGEHYKSALYYSNDEEKKIIEDSMKKIAMKLKVAKVETQVFKAMPFYPAEEYHQDYYLKNPIRYKYYRYNCGRDQRLKEIWK